MAIKSATREERLQQKRREEAAKLSNPRPIELPSGKWRCQVMVNGKRLSAIDDDPSRAHAKALALKAGLADLAELQREHSAGGISLSDAIDAYIERRDNILSPSTINGYKEIKRNRFKGLMKAKVRDITAKDLQEAVNKEAAVVSHKTIKNALGLTVSVLSEYGQNVDVKKIRLPQRKRQEHKFLDEEGMINLFESIQGNMAEIPILLAVWLGMRRSEIMGLCWDCVDFDASKISVKRTYVKGKDGGYVLRDEMKTDASRRVIDCPGYIMTKLSLYEQDEERRVGRVFRMHPNSLYKALKTTCERNDIDFVGVHGLRHTNATVMLSLGIIDKVAMARGGWSTDVTMKQVYQHIFVSDQKGADQKIDAFFSSIAEGKNPKIAHEFAHEGNKA